MYKDYPQITTFNHCETHKFIKTQGIYGCLLGIPKCFFCKNEFITQWMFNHSKCEI